jgi:hypothetical protein
MWRKCPIYVREGFCLQCYISVTGGGRGCRDRPRWLKLPRGVSCPMLKREQFRVHASGVAETCLELCALSKQVPSLIEFLSQSTWEDGTSRQTGTLTVMVHDGVLKAAVNDRESSSSAFVSGKSFTSLLKAVDKGLAEGSLDFRVKVPYTPQRGKKRT